jgi:DNA-binding NarL/FixJ family response regulator
MPDGHLGWEIVKNSEISDRDCRVLIVDRDPMGSDLLARALEHEGTCRAAAIRADDLLRAILSTQARVVVIAVDLRTNKGDGFSLAEEVTRVHPDLFVVLLLPQSSRESVINAFRVGARAVFPREWPIADFLDCIARVQNGFLWVAGQEATLLLQAFRSIPAPKISTALKGLSLTDRELQVVQHAATGKTNKEIARELCLSEHTVKNYLFKAFDKLGVSSRIELLFYLTLSGHAAGKSAPALERADGSDEGTAA